MISLALAMHWTYIQRIKKLPHGVYLATYYYRLCIIIVVVQRIASYGRSVTKELSTYFYR